MAARVTRPLLLDTCAVIWLMEQSPFSADAMEAMVAAYERGEALSVSPVTAWEIGLLVSRGRISSITNPAHWLKTLVSQEGIAWTDLPPDVLLAASFLPGEPHADPADRMLMATAREKGMTLVTRDRKILDYAAKGHVSALAC